MTRSSSSDSRGHEIAAQLVDANVAGPHHCGGILVIDQRQQQVLQRDVFVALLVGEGKASPERLLQTARERWDQISLLCRLLTAASLLPLSLSSARCANCS